MSISISNMNIQSTFVKTGNITNNQLIAIEIMNYIDLQLTIYKINNNIDTKIIISISSKLDYEQNKYFNIIVLVQYGASKQFYKFF